jgi:hypothetical protein
MEEGYGGPVWHASAAPFGVVPVRSHLRDCALAALEGVGDASLGEWEDWTGRAFHVRRRLTDEERDGLEVVDVRGTPEAERRLRAVQRFLPASQLAMARAEMLGEG